MIHSIENNELKVSVNDFGAELWSIWDKREGSERLWQGQPDIWPRRAPIIFPVCGRLTNETLVLAGKKYPMTLHGFARDYTHQVIEQSSDSIRLRLCQNDETIERFPFDFQFDSIISLSGNSIRHAFEVTNNSDREMPFSIGYHTGYICPFDSTHDAEDYSLMFECMENVPRQVVEDMHIVGTEPYLENTRELPLRHDMFQPNICFTGLQSKYVRLLERDTGNSIRVDFENFPTLVLWSTREHIPFVCIEPWHGLFEPAESYGEFTNKPGVRIISPTETFSCAQTVTFEHAVQKRG